MKIFILSFMLLGFMVATTQTSYFDFKKFKSQQNSIENPKKGIVVIPKQDLNFTHNYRHPLAKYLFSLNNGNTIYALPQDNMICIVPNLSEHNMPNLYSGKKVYGMPPGSAPPLQIIPEKIR